MSPRRGAAEVGDDSAAGGASGLDVGLDRLEILGLERLELLEVVLDVQSWSSSMGGWRMMVSKKWKPWGMRPLGGAERSPSG